MAYISSQRVAEIRNELKATFPEYKFSITRSDWSGITIAILEAPVLLTDKKDEEINVYWVKEIKDGNKRKIFETILGIAQKGVKYYETGDYGNQPSFYTYLSVGKWDKPFKMIIKNEKGKAVAGIKIKSLKNVESAFNYK